jgi:hypothetical protein
LARQLTDLERICKLTDAQKKKLQRAGRGDIKRFFDRYEELKGRAVASEQGEPMDPEIWKETGALNLILFQAALFRGDSLLLKALPNTLTAEQLAHYDATAREHRASHHRDTIEKVVDILIPELTRAAAGLGRKLVLREGQRQALIALLSQETKPPPKPGPYDVEVLLIQLRNVPGEKLKRVFDENQLEIVYQQLAGYQLHEPMLKRAGLMPVEEEQADTSQ